MDGMDPTGDAFNWIAAHEQMRESFRQMASVMNEGVQELIGQGWAEEQARTLVYAMMVQSLMGGGGK